MNMQPTRYTFEDRIEEMVRDYADLEEGFFTDAERQEIEGCMRIIAATFAKGKTRTLIGRYKK